MEMYKRISSGLVPMCRGCGRALGAVCDDEAEVLDYISRNTAYCAACLFKGETVNKRAVDRFDEAYAFRERLIKTNAECSDICKFLSVLGYSGYRYMCVVFKTYFFSHEEEFTDDYATVTLTHPLLAPTVLKFTGDVGKIDMVRAYYTPKRSAWLIDKIKRLGMAKAAAETGVPVCYHTKIFKYCGYVRHVSDRASVWIKPDDYSDFILAGKAKIRDYNIIMRRIRGEEVDSKTDGIYCNGKHNAGSDHNGDSSVVRNCRTESDDCRHSGGEESSVSDSGEDEVRGVKTE